MIPIIVAFSKLEQAKSIKGILARGGFFVAAICTSGAHVLQAANELGDGIVLCGSRLTDMVYRQLYQDLPPHFQMLLLAPPGLCGRREPQEIQVLSMPLKAQELLETTARLEETIIRRKKRRRQAPRVRTQEEEQLIARAKALLMEEKQMPEAEAHRYLQKVSMDSGRGLAETAQMLMTYRDSGTRGKE